MDLKKKREELKAQLQELDKELDKENLRYEIKELNEITNQLDSMFQHPILEKHCQDKTNVLYEVMLDINRKIRELRREIGENEFYEVMQDIDRKAREL